MSTCADVGRFIESKTSVVQTSNVGFTSEVADYLVMHTGPGSLHTAVVQSLSATVNLHVLALLWISTRLTSLFLAGLSALHEPFLLSDCVAECCCRESGETGVYLALEAYSKSERRLVVSRVDCCPPLDWVGVAWPGLGDGDVMTAGVGVAGGQPPVTEGVEERTTFANKEFTNGGQTPLSSPPTFVFSIEVLPSEGRGRRRRPSSTSLCRSG